MPTNSPFYPALVKKEWTSIRAVVIAVAGLVLSSCSGSPSGLVSPKPTVALSSPAPSPVQAAPIQKEEGSQTKGGTPRIPPVGSPERKQILDTLREQLQPSLNGREVLFKVIQLDVLDGWAFVRA